MKPLSMTRRLLVGAAFAFAVGATQAAWPERPIRIIVHAAAGGSPDIMSRLVGEELGRRLGQPVVIDNRPGAAGNIGMQTVMTAVPDGYTIGYGNNATLATNEFLFSKLPYDPAKLEPIIALARTPSLLVVNKDSSIRTVQDLVTYAKKQPNGISFASGGNGTAGHLGAELFKQMTGIQGQHVPYKGAPQAITDLMAGNVQFLFDNIASIGPNVTGGKLRAIAITSKERSPLFANVPTLDESGLRGFEMTAWGALVAPPGTPRTITDRLNKELNAVLKEPEAVAHLSKLGFSPIGGSPQDLRQLMTTERVKWGDVVQKSGAKVD